MVFSQAMGKLFGMAVVSISRQFGAGGKTLGESIALDLGYRFVHEGILDKMASEECGRMAAPAGANFYARSYLSSMLSSLGPQDFFDSCFSDSDTCASEEYHLQALTEVVKQLAGLGNVVFLGRGTQFILKEQKSVLKILLVSDIKNRVDFLSKAYGYKKSKSLSLIKKADKKRAKFLRLFWPSEPNETSHYHMVLNTSRVPLEVAKKQIIALVMSCS